MILLSPSNQLIEYQNDLNVIIIDKKCAIRMINENISYTQFSTTHIMTLFAEKKITASTTEQKGSKYLYE